ncbi:MAG: hypothetical protein ACOCNL_08590 [Acetivibrio ethanolgignens]
MSRKSKKSNLEKHIEELENDILMLHEENSRLRILLEQQQEIFKEYIKETFNERVRPISFMNNNLYEEIRTEIEIRRNENLAIRAMISDVALDVDKIASSRLGRLFFRL